MAVNLAGSGHSATQQLCCGVSFFPELLATRRITTKPLLVARTLLVAKCITTSNKKLLVTSAVPFFNARGCRPKSRQATK